MERFKTCSDLFGARRPIELHYPSHAFRIRSAALEKNLDNIGGKKNPAKLIGKNMPIQLPAGAPGEKTKRKTENTQHKSN
jgi:hypothetical protein